MLRSICDKISCRLLSNASLPFPAGGPIRHLSQVLSRILRRLHPLRHLCPEERTSFVRGAFLLKLFYRYAYGRDQSAMIHILLVDRKGVPPDDDGEQQGTHREHSELGRSMGRLEISGLLRV